MATLKDIAQKVGTSITTVSRVLNYDDSLSVSEKVRKNIFDTASKLNYKLPKKKRDTTQKKRYKVGIAHWYDVQQELEDPYYLMIRKGIEKAAFDMDIDTTILYKENGEYNLKNIHGLDGLICVGKFSSAQINRFSKLTTNLVFVDSSPNVDLYDSVVIDFNKAVKDLLNEIIKEGYSKIGYIGGVEKINSHTVLGERRELVFRDYLFQKNKLNHKYIHIGTFSSESGYELMKDALSKKDYAEIYFCANDSIAIGALRAVHEKGLKIPGDISLVGFNDNPGTEYTYPPLSTVKVYTEFMGEQSIQSLKERIEGRTIPIRKIVPTIIVKRKSF
jgi:LacI family transcriptional regulator